MSGVEPVVIPNEAIDRAVAFLRATTQTREVETDDDQ
jgi:hypothetical protein